MTTTDLFYIEQLNKLAQLTIDDDSYELNLVPANKSGLVISNIPDYLKDELIVIDSIKSGTGRGTSENIYESVLQPLFKIFSISHSYIATSSSSSISQLAKRLLSGSYTIIFISGDTSVNEFINSLPHVVDHNGKANINFFPIPAGTGNSLALSLGLLDISTSIAKLFSGTKDKLNLYRASLPLGSYYLNGDTKTPISEPINFLVVFSWGFHASLVADSDTLELRKFGLERFQIAAKNNLSREQVYPGNYKINDKVYQGPFSYWVLTPSSRFEPKFVILPKGSILDANLYVISFKTDTDIMEVMTEVYNDGAHIHNPKVTYEEIDQEVTLNTTTDEFLQRRFCIDGAIVVLPDSKEEQTVKVQVVGNVYNNWSLYVLH